MAVYRDYILRDTPEKVLNRLRPIAQQDLLLGLSSAPEGSVVAWIGERTFRLRVAHAWNNAFAPIVYGKLESAPEGTRVTIRLSYGRLVTGMLILFYGMCLVIPLLGAVGIQSGSFRWRGGGDPWRNSLVGAAVIFGASQVMALLNRTDRSELLSFTDQTFAKGPEGNA